MVHEKILYSRLCVACVARTRRELSGIVFSLLRMLFCPFCANILLIETGVGGCTLSSGGGGAGSDTEGDAPMSGVGDHRLYCRTCSYVCGLPSKISKKINTKKKHVDDVLGGADAWKNVDKTES